MLMTVIPTMRMKNVFSVEVELNTPHVQFQLDDKCEINQLSLLKSSLILGVK